MQQLIADLLKAHFLLLKRNPVNCLLGKSESQETNGNMCLDTLFGPMENVRRSLGGGLRGLNGTLLTY